MMTLKESLERSVGHERFNGGLRDLEKALGEAARLTRVLRRAGVSEQERQTLHRMDQRLKLLWDEAGDLRR